MQQLVSNTRAVLIPRVSRSKNQRTKRRKRYRSVSLVVKKNCKDVRKDCKKAKNKKPLNNNNNSNDAASNSHGDGNSAFVMEAESAECKQDIWLMDSGATDHYTFHREWFVTFEAFANPMAVHVGNKSTMDAVGKGRIDCDVLINGRWSTCHIDNVLYVPTSRRNLMSLAVVLDKGLVMRVDRQKCEFVKNGIVLLCGERYGNLYKLHIRATSARDSQCEVNLAAVESLQVWHERLGHQHKQHVEKFLRERGIKVATEEFFCKPCVQGKQQTASFNSRTQRATRSGEIIHADVCGPNEKLSLGGSKYFVCFTCDYSKFRIVHFLKEKSEVPSKVEELLKFVENQCGRPLRIFQSDGGLEFNNEKVKNLLKANGVQFVITNPYSPEQNGCAERSNSTIVECTHNAVGEGAV